MRHLVDQITAGRRFGILSLGEFRFRVGLRLGRGIGWRVVHRRDMAVGIDARDGRVAVRGWVETSAVRATELAARVAAQGVQTVIHTDIARDGMLSGPNFDEALALQAKGPRVIVSGGVASVADLRAVASAGLAGAITGRAIYEGRFTLTEALAALAS